MLVVHRHSKHPPSLARLLLIGAILMPTFLVGCTDVGQRLYISSNTVVGLDVIINTARNSGRVQFGYDRYFVTWVPQSVPVPNEPGAKEVMAALNCTELTVGDLAIKKFEESLATGVAAEKFAEMMGKSEKPVHLFECFKE